MAFDGRTRVLLYATQDLKVRPSSEFILRQRRVMHSDAQPQIRKQTGVIQKKCVENVNKNEATQLPWRQNEGMTALLM